MEQWKICPLCNEETYWRTEDGKYMCRSSRCGWKGIPMSSADVPDIGEPTERTKRYKELVAEFERRDKVNG